MRVARLIAVLYTFATTDIVHATFYRKAYSDRSIQRIVRSIARQDIIIEIHMHHMDDAMKRLLDVLTEALIGTWPLQIIISGNREHFHPENMASSRTLFVYIYKSYNDISRVQLNIMLRDMRLISHPKQVPRILLIIVCEERTSKARRQLGYLWDLQVFDVIVMEVSFLARYPDPVFVAAHCFNGFNENYSRLSTYENGMNLYPNKVGNLYGNMLRVTFEQARPYGTLESRSGKIGGLAKTFSDILSKALNATVIHARFWRDSDLIYNAHGLVHTEWYSTNHDHTVAIDDDRICLLIPASPHGSTVIDLWRIIATILTGFLVTAMVWYISIALNVDKRVRQPMNTISLILGIVPMYPPRSLVEKMLFVTVTITSAEYSFIFQAELLDFVIKYSDNVYVSTFQDLYETGLKVLISSLVYDELVKDERLSPAMLNRFRSLSADHRGTLDASKAYFMSEIDGRLAEIKTADRDSGRVFKVSDLCVMSFNRVHMMPVRSPYKYQINEVLLLLAESGLAKKDIDDFWRSERAGQVENDSVFVINYHSVYIAFFVILMGYLISLIAFVGELIVGRVPKRMRSSARTRYPHTAADL